MELAESESARGEREMGLGGKAARPDKSEKMQRNLINKFVCCLQTLEHLRRCSRGEYLREQTSLFAATNEGSKTMNQNICAYP